MIDIIETQSFRVDGLVLIEESGAVWRTFSRPWWDISSWFWWWLCPGRKKMIITKHNDGRRTRVRAVRIAKSYLHIGSKSRT